MKWASRLKQGLLRRSVFHGNPFGIVPVIVYQMAKVGSSAVATALERSGETVFHVHRMDEGHLHQVRERRRSLGWQIPPIPRHDLLGLRIRRDLIDRGHRARVVTLVRDPFARNLSSYFEHLDAVWQTSNAHELIPIETLIAGFVERFPHDEPLTWFDDEMMRVTGIDVYAHPFPPCGYRTVSTRQFDLLILKSELADEVKSAVLADFTGHTDLVIRRENRTAGKSKAKAWSAVAKALRLDDALVERVVTSRYVTHFFTSEERDRLRSLYCETHVRASA
jgi:hypothetical protein